MGSKIPFFKICIVGNFAVGKTTLLHQYLERRFISNVTTTIGSNFFVKYLKIPNVKNPITLQIWDLAGQEHFKWIRHEFYKGAKGIVYVFDLINRRTFDDLKKWKNEIEKSIEEYSSVLIGNKSDLLNPENIKINKEECDDLKNFLGACGYFETSAKSGHGVEEFFLKLVIQMYKSANL
ncbi:MAG: GTP-binding protein [Promethearchaeota archaeon]|nr:MAG: GTP-binding protein [Candidatus Lokiarchaeota archaeon]